MCERGMICQVGKIKTITKLLKIEVHTLAAESGAVVFEVSGIWEKN